MSDTLATRERYRPDGKMKWERLPVLLVAPFAAAVGAAWLLNFVFEQGWYFVFIVPMLAAVLLGGLSMFCVWWSHCRKPFVAGMLGLCVGLGGYLGYYHCGLVQALPPGNLHRVDLLPDYIAFRMAIEVADDDPPGNHNRPGQAKQREPKIGSNWIRFAWELGSFVICCAAMPWYRARHPYSAELGIWLTRERIRLHPKSPQPLREAFEKGDFEGFAAAARPAGTGEQNPATSTIEFVNSPDVSPLEYPVYLSVHEPAAIFRAMCSIFRRRSRFQQIRLEPRETLALKPLFPKLAAALSIAHEELRDLPTKSRTSFLNLTEPLLDATDVAEIVPVPEPYGGQVFSKSNQFLGGILVLSPLFVLLTGIGAIFLGFIGAELEWEFATIAGTFAAAAFCVGFGLVGFFCCAFPLECWYWRRLLHRAIRRRPDACVDPDDPGVMLVGITNREKWRELHLESDVDVGLLGINSQRGQLCIEADSDRYLIPAGSLAAIETEGFMPSSGNGIEAWYIRLVMQTEEGTRELLFCHRSADLKPRIAFFRKEIAVDLCRRIREMAQPNA